MGREPRLSRAGPRVRGCSARRLSQGSGHPVGPQRAASRAFPGRGPSRDLRAHRPLGLHTQTHQRPGSGQPGARGSGRRQTARACSPLPTSAPDLPLLPEVLPRSRAPPGPWPLPPPTSGETARASARRGPRSPFPCCRPCERFVLSLVASFRFTARR